MSINLNHAQFGAQFKEFVDFATRNAADQRRSVYAMVKDIVQSEEAQPGILPA